MQPGDVIILGSDGLLDNCYTNEIVSLAPKSADKVAEVSAWHVCAQWVALEGRSPIQR